MTRRRTLISIGALLLIGLLASLVVARQLIFGQTPHPHVAHSSPLTATPCVAIASGSGVHAFTIDSQQSLASYHASFSGLGQPLPGDVLGETHDVSGEFLIVSSPSPTITSLRILVDLRTLDSGDATRDEHLREQTFETDKYPYATFTAANGRVLPGAYADRQNVTFQLTGVMTAHGISRTTTFDVMGQFSNNAVSGSANTTLHLQDFKMHPPQAAPGVTISNDVSIVVRFVAPAEQCTHLNATPAAS